MDNPTSVKVESTSDDTYTYTFDRNIEDANFGWLTNNQSIGSYDARGKVLSVHAKRDMASLNDSFIIPGLKQTFGSSLKVDTLVKSR